MEWYLLVKALHLISVICWMVGLLYLPRLFVYHTAAVAGGELDKTLQVMERRLYRYIMLPAMLFTLGFGIWLVVIVGGIQLGTWFHLKMLLLIGLFAIHGLCGKYRRGFERGANHHTARFYRIFNEVPTVIMVAVVILAVLKP